MHLLLLIVLGMIGGTLAQFRDHMYLLDECIEDQYKCQNGRCISTLAVCDGFDDCLDGSDENLCSDKLDIAKCYEDNKFVCLDHKACIPHNLVCSGYSECNDHSDEIGCETNKADNNSSCAGFECGSEECISRHWVCDGYVDCADKSDETDNSCFHKKASDSLHNDTIRLCPDTARLDLFMFYCEDRSYCLPHEDLCDGMKDCRDGSDEGTFCTKWNSQCVYAKCDETCKPTPQGPRCKCSQAIAAVNSSCDTADYCGTLPSACSQYCANGKGNYSCSCQNGYKENGNLCHATGESAVLYYTTDHEVRSYNLKSGENKLLTSGRHPQSAVTDGTWIYWIETSEGRRNVMKANLLNIANTKEVFLGIGLDQPDELALDWLGNNIYLTESQHGYIAVCNMSGSVCALLRNKNDIKRPRHVALDPTNGLMYWADFIKVPRIQRAKMDGTDIQSLTLIKTYPPSALALDIPNRKIYWAEPKVGISVMNFDGTGKYEFVAQFIHAPNSLTVFENEIYWDDHVVRVMQSTSKMDGNSRRKELFKIDDRVTGITMYHPLLHRRMDHACENSACSHLCVLTGHSTSTCMCGGDAVLQTDKRTCSGNETDQYLVVVGGSTVTKVHFNTLTKPGKDTTKIDVGLVQALAYNPTDKVVYIFDTFRKVIYKLHVDAFNEGVKDYIVIPDIEDIIDMSFDYLTGVLYFIQTGEVQSKLEVYDVNSNRKSILHTFEDKVIPISICVIPEYGTLMVAVYQLKDSIIRVDRMNLDGTDRVNIYQTKYAGFHVSVTYSPDEDLVFIADPGQSVIEHIHPEGTGRDHFRRVFTSVVLMSAVQKILFWVNKQSSDLNWANIDDHINSLGTMELSNFSSHTQLYLASVIKPKNLGKHPCLSSPPKCTHICVQTKHSSFNISTSSYTCLCPPGLFLENNKCVRRVACKEGQLKCNNSNICYSKDKFCDGVDDCPKREDEIDCPDHSICKKDQYNCPYTDRCIARHQLCDGHADCVDHSDEDDKYCPFRKCQSDEFKCTGGLCILSTWVCDGEADCQDGSDELRCVNTTCDEGSFRCNDGQCIDLHLRCDGRKDCLDWSDEDKCTKYEDILPVNEGNKPMCDGRLFICPTNRSICLPMLTRCDGKNDCPDGADERDCDLGCPPSHYMCKNWYECVPYHVLCDRKTDCSDGSDETKEACYYKTRLLTTTVSPLELELPCETGFRCKDGTCLDMNFVCDGENTCSDGTDEGGRCFTACAIRAQICQHICIPTPVGPVCLCHNGFILDPVEQTCKDEDECASDVCSQGCTNVVGSYVCSCYSGYALRNDGHSCKSTMGNVTFLYISGTKLQAVRLHEGLSTVVYDDPNVVELVDLDFDPKLNMLYVTTRKELIVIEDNSVIINITNIGIPTLVSADWITGNVYIVDATPNNPIIRVCNIRKDLCTTLYYIPESVEVKTLTIDPINRKLFYCAWDETRKSTTIYMANLSGGNTTSLQEIRSCTGLTVDHHKRLLYIAQSDGRIRRLAYSGRWSKDLITRDFHLQSPIGLQLFEDHIYSIDALSHRISRCLKIGSKHCEAHIYRVVNAKAFVIRHDNSELRDGDIHCNVKDCESTGCEKKECACFGEEGSEGSLCVDFPVTEYYSVLPKTLQHHSSHTGWVVTIVILLLLICAIAIYMWKKEHRFMKRFTPSNCCTRHRRIVRQRLDSAPHDSWQYSEQEAADTSENVTVHVDTHPTGGVTNASFVNWLYASFSRNKKESKYEPRVSVHLKKSTDKMSEPLAGTSKKYRDQKDDVVSDTESELDVKDLM